MLKAFTILFVFAMIPIATVNIFWHEEVSHERASLWAYIFALPTYGVAFVLVWLVYKILGKEDEFYWSY